MVPKTGNQVLKCKSTEERLEMTMAVGMITMVGMTNMMLLLLVSLTFIHSSIPGISNSELRNKVTVREMDQWFRMPGMQA